MTESQNASARVRVLIVDDQLPFHDAAHTLIDATPGFEWIGGASSGEEGIEQAERLRPDLVLMDVRMPGIGGIEAARRMASRGLPLIVVLIPAMPTSRGALPTTSEPRRSFQSASSPERCCAVSGKSADVDVHGHGQMQSRRQAPIKTDG